MDASDGLAKLKSSIACKRKPSKPAYNPASRMRVLGSPFDVRPRRAKSQGRHDDLTTDDIVTTWVVESRKFDDKGSRAGPVLDRVVNQKSVRKRESETLRK